MGDNRVEDIIGCSLVNIFEDNNDFSGFEYPPAKNSGIRFDIERNGDERILPEGRLKGMLGALEDYLNDAAPLRTPFSFVFRGKGELSVFGISNELKIRALRELLFGKIGIVLVICREVYFATRP